MDKDKTPIFVVEEMKRMLLDEHVKDMAMIMDIELYPLEEAELHGNVFAWYASDLCHVSRDVIEYGSQNRASEGEASQNVRR